ncbi:MAG: type II secretion system protein GspE [Gammaproteobacteria bacterium]|nr:type II secretion system protein GspE [Gammaproteobacteria bacterium]MYJ75648.1 type II secretion system protein GspE [Gammaproteobacteria bacterium]
MAANLTQDPSREADTTSPLPFAFARRFGVVVSNGASEGEPVTVACRAQPPLTVLAEIKRVTKRPMRIEIVSRDEFEQRLTAAYVRDASEAKQMVADLGDHPDLASLAESVPEGEGEDLLDQRNDAPIVQLITAVLAEAIREGASDVHIETFEKALQVRFRIDGVMREMVQPKRALAPLLVSRVKVMAKLDIAEKRIPQDGRITLKIGGREVDVRVSTLPTANGERVVLRLLDKQTAALALPNLGMDAQTLSRVREVVAKPHGIFLVTGPTGHGKTTTLYAAMGELNRESINILTIENPIEYSIAGIGQTQVNEKADMTFARGLRAILRQDPDVVMVGEIRDLETAQTAVHASLTGHLVMSTVHTNTAVGAVTRLVDIGVEPFLIASSVVGILAQRLVRVLCTECKSAREPNALERMFLAEHADRATVYHPSGCDACGWTGFRGRTGIYELVTVDDHARTLVHDQVSEQAITEYVRRDCPSISDDGRRKVLDGVTSVNEVMRAVVLSD